MKKICILYYHFLIMASSVLADYWTEREILIKREQAGVMGGSLKLDENEEMVNQILMNYKWKEWDEGFKNPDTFLAAQHFFKARTGIEKSKVFQLIKKLPKGASLHAHDTSLISEDYLFKLTYRRDLYACTQGENLRLKFFNASNIDRKCDWRLVKDLRENDINFDTFLRSKMTLIVEDPYKTYPSDNDVWRKFQNIFVTIGDMIGYRPIWKEYFYQALRELYEDNIRYFEFRSILPQVYDLQGNTYDAVQVAGIYYKTLQKFMMDYPDFIGARLIYAPSRFVRNLTVDSYVRTYKQLKQAYPDFIAGFDLVGQEDKGSPLKTFIPELLKLKELGAHFFFHAGETKWNGESTDFNLYDAILLNTTRIGHGYAVLKHPQLQRLIKERDIALEIAPISNQVLKLVDDVRNHPAAVLMANNFPVVVAQDDPTFWGAKGVSYDWYVAFMGLAGRNDDLRFLKKLAQNSWRYSCMSDSERNKAYGNWEVDWAKFIEEVLNEHHPK